MEGPDLGNDEDLSEGLLEGGTVDENMDGLVVGNDEDLPEGVVAGGTVDGENMEEPDLGNDENLPEGAVAAAGFDLGVPVINKVKRGSARSARTIRTCVEPAIALAEKAVLLKEDVICSICWSILYEPATLPCKHSLCLMCYVKHVEETSLCCPCCRRRIAVWSRNARKRNELLDKVLWSRLKDEFPDLIRARENGDDSQDLLPAREEQEPGTRDGIICDNDPRGALYDELRVVLKPHEEDLQKQREMDEAASLDLIKKMQEEENQRIAIQEAKEREDARLAQQLAIQEAEQQKAIYKENVPRKSLREKKRNSKYFEEFSIALAKPKKETRWQLKSNPSSKKSNQNRQCSSRQLSSSSSVRVPSSGDQSQESATRPSPRSPHKNNSPCSSTLNHSDAKTSAPSGAILSDMPFPLCKVESTSFEDHASVQNFEEVVDEKIDNEEIKLPKSAESNTFPNSDDIVYPSDNEDENDKNYFLIENDDFLLDYDDLEKKANQVQELREKKEQEMADQAFALSLQRKFNLGLDDPRGRDSENEYSIRTWKRARGTLSDKQ